MSNKIISKEEAIFFLDMINSSSSPNFVPQFFKRKPYILKANRESTNYEKFIEIYQKCMHVLNEQEQTILNKYYGANEERQTLLPIAQEFKLSKSRIQFLVYMAERKISYLLQDVLKS